MPASEKKREREMSTYTVAVRAADTRFKGRRTISRYDREPREMYYLFVVSAILASEPRRGMSGLREKHPLVCYKGTEVGPCLQALHLVCTRDVLAKRIRERYRGRLSCC